MKNTELLSEALSTFFSSWGSDTPQEVYWGTNELVDFLNAEFELKLPYISMEDEDSKEKLLDTIDLLNFHIPTN